MLEFEAETVESKMVRFRYGPWDARYRSWIGVLTAKGVIVARSELPPGYGFDSSAKWQFVQIVQPLTTYKFTATLCKGPRSEKPALDVPAPYDAGATVSPSVSVGTACQVDDCPGGLGRSPIPEGFWKPKSRNS